MKLSRILTVFIVVGFVVGIVSVVLASMRSVLSIWPELLAAAGFITASGSIPGAVCASLLERGRFRPLMWTGVICAGVATISWLGVFVTYSMTWTYSVGFVNVLVLPSVYAFLVMLVGLLFGRRSRIPLYPIVAGLSIAGGIAASVCVALTVWTDGAI